jgi:hypothetical protein
MRRCPVDVRRVPDDESFVDIAKSNSMHHVAKTVDAGMAADCEAIRVERGDHPCNQADITR